MFILSKLFTYLFLPPGIFILMVLAGTVLTLSGRRKSGTAFLLTVSLLIYLLSITPVKDFILLPLEDAFPFQENPSCEAIVVLGGGRVSHSPDEGMKSSVKPQVAKRLYTAFKLWKSTKKPLILSGGKVFDEGGEPESTAMRRFLVQLGVPITEIIEENKSKNTFQNAVFTYKILKRLNVNRICLVTSAYHMPRSFTIFKAVGSISVTPVPADYRVDRDPYSWSDFFPSIGNLYDSFLGIHEYVGILYFNLIQKYRYPPTGDTTAKDLSF